MRQCGALRSRNGGNQHVLTGVPSLGAGGFRCLQSFLIGLLVSEPIGTIKVELPVLLEAAAARALKVPPLSVPFSALLCSPALTADCARDAAGGRRPLPFNVLLMPQKQPGSSGPFGRAPARATCSTVYVDGGWSLRSSRQHSRRVSCHVVVALSRVVSIPVLALEAVGCAR